MAPPRRAATAPRPAQAKRGPRGVLATLAAAAEAALVLGALALTLLWASIPDPEPLTRENPSTTAFIELRRQQAAAQRRELRLKWQWRRLEQISPLLRAAVIYAEDARFYQHEGVDWSAIEKAVESNYARGSLAIGGSTITQQLAKNLYLSPSRSMLRKVRELLITSRLEHSLEKQRILELYLNVAEWGDGVFGAEAAARHWFGRSASKLTAVQAARLAVALPNPFVRNPRRHSAAMQRKVAKLLALLRRDGLLSAAAFRAATQEAGLPLPSAPEASQPDTAPIGDAPDGPEPIGNEATKESSDQSSPASTMDATPSPGDDDASKSDAMTAPAAQQQ